MIFVTVGTHHQPFDRLVRAAADIADLDEVVVQRGTSTVSPTGCTVHDQMSPAEWRDCVARARLVVTHAGPASIFAALEHGVPIVVPRRSLWREHVDEHQCLFAERLERRVRVLHDPSVLRSAVIVALAEIQSPEPNVDPIALSQRFDVLVRDLLPDRS